MCRTFQKYGAIIVDSGAAIDVQVYNTDWNAYPWAAEYCATTDCSIAMPNDLMAKFRVIDWSKWTGA
jgi:hypothetical protein